MSTNYKEKYKRPCFAPSESGTYGIIILESGISTGDIHSVEEGEVVAKALVDGKSISSDDALRIGDQFRSHNLPDFKKRDLDSSALIGLLLVAALAATMRQDGPDPHKHRCSKCGKEWEHDGATCGGSIDAHKCPQCGSLQWDRHDD
jgi:hypothetical protein